MVYAQQIFYVINFQINFAYKCKELCTGVYVTSLVFSLHRDVALAIVNSKSWQDAMRWRAENDKYGLHTPMKLLITHMPGKFKYDFFRITGTLLF